MVALVRDGQDGSPFALRHRPGVYRVAVRRAFLCAIACHCALRQRAITHSGGAMFGFAPF